MFSRDKIYKLGCKFTKRSSRLFIYKLYIFVGVLEDNSAIINLLILINKREQGIIP